MSSRYSFSYSVAVQYKWIRAPKYQRGVHTVIVEIVDLMQFYVPVGGGDTGGGEFRRGLDQ